MSLRQNTNIDKCLDHARFGLTPRLDFGSARVLEETYGFVSDIVVTCFLLILIISLFLSMGIFWCFWFCFQMKVALKLVYFHFFQMFRLVPGIRIGALQFPLVMPISGWGRCRNDFRLA